MIGRTAIITGGTGGLGTAVVEKFAEAGASIALPLRSMKSLSKVPDSAKNQTAGFLADECDLTSEKDVAGFVSRVLQKFGGVHYLLNIAGAYTGGTTIAKAELDDWNKMLNANLHTTIVISRAVLPVMTNQQFGRIINIGSMQALSPRAKSGPYAVSKRGVITLTEVIAEEVKGTGVTANAIVPSMIATVEAKAGLEDKEYSRWVTPEEIAGTMLFLCSDAAASINGNSLKMYGAY